MEIKFTREGALDDLFLRFKHIRIVNDVAHEGTEEGLFFFKKKKNPSADTVVGGSKLTLHHVRISY